MVFLKIETVYIADKKIGPKIIKILKSMIKKIIPMLKR